MFYVELTYGNYFSSPVFCFNLSSEELLDFIIRTCYKQILIFFRWSQRCDVNPRQSDLQYVCSRLHGPCRSLRFEYIKRKNIYTQICFLLFRIEIKSDINACLNCHFTESNICKSRWCPHLISSSGSYVWERNAGMNSICTYTMYFSNKYLFIF